MRLGYFTMPVHPASRNPTDTLREDREIIILADKLGFHDAFVGEHLTEKSENVTNSFIFLATLIHATKNIKLAMVVPGSGLVKEQAEREGLHEIFKAAGFEWREPGCSMCLAMNADRLEPGERCASTSNRNFEGRQGNGGRTHLVSPAMAAAAAIHGHFVDVRQFS